MIGRRKSHVFPFFVPRCRLRLGKILQDFQSKALKAEWEKHQKYMIAKGNDRRLEEFRLKENLDQRLNSFRQQDSIRQQQLDDRIDDLQAKFADVSTALQFDTNRIDQKLSSMNFKGETRSSCLAPRTRLAKCFNVDRGIGCDDIIKELERCVEETVVFKRQ